MSEDERKRIYKLIMGDAERLESVMLRHNPEMNQIRKDWDNRSGK